jgi:hypothetical protein
MKVIITPSEYNNHWDLEMFEQMVINLYSHYTIESARVATADDALARMFEKLGVPVTRVHILMCCVLDVKEKRKESVWQYTKRLLQAMITIAKSRREEP